MKNALFVHPGILVMGLDDSWGLCLSIPGVWPVRPEMPSHSWDSSSTPSAVESLPHWPKTRHKF